MSVVDEVKQRIDIVDLVGQYVPLQRAGRNFKALCPFHTERTPSFMVFPERQSWHCFGACGSGGDVFTFLMKRENVEFGEALRLLAERAGVTLGGRSDPQEDARRQRLREANEAAAQYFHQALLSSSAGQLARDYLASRGLDEATVEGFQLGYSLPAWDALKGHLMGRGFSEEELLTAGLLVEGERGGYDRFRGRLMFPIRDERGRVAGFGARALDDSEPKYLNTTQTPIFDKGAILYALDRAKEQIRRQELAVIVEGYTDAIAAHQHGLGNVVASMGTSLTERQVNLLKRYTRNLALALDADVAGSEATLRGIQVAADALDKTSVPVPDWRGVIRHQDVLAADIRVISLPEGRDPDDVIRSDPEDWRRLTAEAKPVLDHLFEAVTARLDMSKPRERSRAVGELLPLVGAVSDQVVRAHYLQRLARLAQVDEETLRLQLRRRGGGRGPEAEGEPPSGPPREPREEFCLALLLRHPDLRERGLALSPELLTMAENRELLEAWRQEPHVDALRQGLLEELREQFERILEKDLPLYEPRELALAFDDCVWRMEQRKLALEKQVSASLLAEDEKEAGSERLVEIAHQVWQSGTPPEDGTPDGALEAGAMLVEDTKRGSRIHQRLIQRRKKGVHGASQEGEEP
ncbi:MAG: DNA primase [Dehalococcoidia bacterium]